MPLFPWCAQRAGGLSILILLALCYWVISQEAALPGHGFNYGQTPASSTPLSSTSAPAPSPGGGFWTLVFAYYCLLIHVMVFAFPLRACWSVWDITNALKRSAKSKAIVDYKKVSRRRRNSATSIASSETLASETMTSDSNGHWSTITEASDIEPDMFTDGANVIQGDVIHAIIIPNYKEEMDTLKETLEVLASHPQARHSYDICLGMELREVNGESKALSLIQEFAKNFRSIDYTLHPYDIPGEAAGKGSNVAWAARKISAKYAIDDRKDVIVTGIDADSHLSPGYFASITNMHLAHPETATTTLYAAPIVFDRNAHAVPAIVRVADILWCAAGISGLYTGSAIAPPTSVYSLPLELVDRVGGWDCGAEAIGEDLHMYLKCFFALNGNLTCRTVLSPVSQTNVTGGGKGGIRGTIVDMRARYKQAIRHMWGALDTGFALRKVVEMWRERKHTARAFRPLHRSQGDHLHCYFPDSQSDGESPERSRESGVFSEVTQDTLQEPHWENVFYLFHRLFEAHFLPVHMTILVLASALYVWAADTRNGPGSLAWIFSLCNILRTLGFMEVACYLSLYESFHRICVTAREREMVAAGLADDMCFSHRSVSKNWIDYILVPLVAPLYGAIPCTQAEISHLWTVDLLYSVSKKATRQRVKVPSTDDMA